MHHSILSLQRQRTARRARAVATAPTASGRPCLVLVPGTLCDARLFAPCLVRLRRLLPQWDFLTIDFQGLQAGPEVWARRVWGALAPQVCLLGFSLGGIAALQLLRQAPHRAQALALVASNAEAGSRRGRLRARRQRAQWQAGGAHRVLRSLMPAYFPQVGVRSRLGRCVRHMALATRTAVAMAQFDWAARRQGGHQVLTSHSGPLLVVSGQRDRFCPRRMQERLVQSRPDATWFDIRRAGHFLPLEHPAALARHVSRWLNHHFPQARGES